MEKIPIMVLDDQKDITRLTSFVLGKHGYEITVSNNPLEAFEVAKEKSFRLMIVDFMMPDMSGLEFIRQAKETETNAEAKFLVLTAKKINEHELRDIFDLGAEIMTKPFVPLKLVEKVSSILT
jgi:two-component system, OmpR family, phosphate regulon response regulator PhoB